MVSDLASRTLDGKGVHGVQFQEFYISVRSDKRRLVWYLLTRQLQDLVSLVDG